jgi:hypothetical protein
MSEVITETILPGTYIEVRAEGLLTVGAVSTGNIALVGTAERGGNTIENLASFEEGRALFGEPGEYDPSAGSDNLSLVRALNLLFANGARTVYAQRVFDPASAVAATYELAAEGGSLKLKAATSGEWANRLTVRVEEATEASRVESELLPRGSGAGAGSYGLSVSKFPQPADESVSLGIVTVRDQGLTNKYQIKTGQPSSSTARLDIATGALSFVAAPSATAEVRATYVAPREALRRVILTFGDQQEAYIVPSLRYLTQLIGDPEGPSKLVAVDQLSGQGLPKVLERPSIFKDGKNGAVTVDHFSAALDRLVEQDIQILVVAGRPFSEIKGATLAHLEKTENLGRERIAVVGADRSDVDKVLENASEVADKRLVLVAPGLASQDARTGRLTKLPPWCTAAAIAGKLASVSPHVSLTNKTLSGIDGIAASYDYGELKALIQNRVLAVQQRRGVRVVKAITTHDEAFQQITLRRIVDYVKVGTRMGADQYIGKLNNRRVRENLRTTLDAFLASLVAQEFLTGYKLSVSADRAQEIRGEVLVTMDLNPTFSIDVVRVVANLS